MSSLLTYTDEENGEIYYIEPDLELPESISGYTRLTDLYAAQSHDGTIFIWFVHHSDTSWYRSAIRSVRICKSEWRRVVARKAANTYDWYAPEEPIPEPSWEDLLPFQTMVEIAFEDRIITSLDHKVLRKLRGVSDDEE